MCDDARTTINEQSCGNVITQKRFQSYIQWWWALADETHELSASVIVVGQDCGDRLMWTPGQMQPRCANVVTTLRRESNTNASAFLFSGDFPGTVFGATGRPRIWGRI